MINKCIIIFFLTFIVDVFWAIYIKKVNQCKPFAAAFVTLFIYLLGGYVIINYTENHYLLYSATAGACIGTYIATKYLE